MTASVAGCVGVRSYMTMRDAWEAVQADLSPVKRTPFRCSTCRWWHVAGTETRDARHRVRVVENTPELVCGGQHGAGHGCMWCACREAAA